MDLTLTDILVLWKVCAQLTPLLGLNLSSIVSINPTIRGLWN